MKNRLFRANKRDEKDNHGFTLKPSPMVVSLDKIKPSHHLCLLYREEKDWESVIIPYLKQGLLKGGKCIYFNSARTPEYIREKLLSHNIQASYYESAGQLEFFYQKRSYIQKDTFDPQKMLHRLISITQTALKEGYSAIYGTGEMDWALESQETLENLIQYEALVNHVLFEEYPFSSICQYNRNTFSSCVIKEVIMTHPYIITDNVYYNFYYIPPQEFLSNRREEKEVNQWLFNLKKEQSDRKRLVFLAHVLENTSQPFLAFYPNGEIITCNEAFIDLLGYREEDLRELTINDFMTTLDFKKMEQMEREELLATHEPQMYNTEYRHKDNRVIPVEILIHRSQPDNNGEHYYAFVTDITDRLKLEEMMGLLSHAVEQSPSAISIMDEEGRIIYVNHYYTKITGYSRRDITGEMADFLEESFTAGPHHREIRDTLKAGLEWEGEIYCHKKDSAPYWASLKLSPVKNYQGNNTYYLAILEDITARKNAENEMQDLYRELKKRFLMENNLALIAREFLDANNFEEAISFAFQKTAELLPLDGILLLLIQKEGLEIANSYYRDPLLTKRSAYSINALSWLIKNLKRGEVVIFHQGNDFPPEAFVEKKIFDSLNLASQGFIPIMRKEKLIGFIEIQSLQKSFELNERSLLFFNTITEMISLLYERKNMEEKIINKNNELHQTLNQLKFTQSKLISQEKMAGIGQLAAGVAHEINNPLGFVISNMETLEKYVTRFQTIIEAYQVLKKDQQNNGDLKESIEEIHHLEKSSRLAFILDDLQAIFAESKDGLERISKIVEGLRFFSRATQKDEFEHYCLNEGIKNTLIVAKNEIKYQANVVENLSSLPPIAAIGGQINQVLLNIIMNAVQSIKEKTFSPYEEGIIHIETYHKDGYVYCLIKDNGLGMKENVIQKIFDPFFTTKEVGEGTGLGLSISHEIIVTKHQGEINVESIIGEGALFTIKLPIKRMETE